MHPIVTLPSLPPPRPLVPMPVLNPKKRSNWKNNYRYTACSPRPGSSLTPIKRLQIRPFPGTIDRGNPGNEQNTHNI
jgi:hypothetical protein